MSTEENKALVRRWVEEVINKQNVAVLAETHTSNSVNHFLPLDCRKVWKEKNS